MLIYSNKSQLINCNYESVERHRRGWLADAWLVDWCACVYTSAVFGRVGNPL